MYKVMIVDDEPLIREGLQTIIDWEAHGFVVGATAIDGKDALAKLEQCAPQLIIVDIRMPGTNGIAFMQTVREFDQHVRFLILSGYADFEYARKAMLVGADGYMLKPVDEGELLELLTTVRQTLDQRSLYSILPHREAWLQALLMEELAELPSAEVLEQLDLLWPQYQVLLVHAADLGTGEPAPLSIYKNIENWIQREQLGYTCETAPYMAVLLRRTYTSNLQLNLLQANIKRAAGTTAAYLALAIGEPTSSLRAISQSYQQAHKGMRSRFFMEEGYVARAYGDDKLVKRAATTIVPSSQPSPLAELVKPLTYALEIGSLEGVKQILSQGAMAMQQAEMTEQEVKHTFIRLLTLSLSKAAAKLSEQRDVVEDQLAWLDGIDSQPSLERMLDYVNNQLEQRVAVSGKDSAEQIVKRMIDLIHRHYGDPLKLESLGEIFHYNSAYLGKLFKSRTGQYFNTYLDQVRVAKAKELLEAGKKVYEVAGLVGYTNVDYFHIKFKKYTGVSPSVYRKKQDSSE